MFYHDSLRRKKERHKRSQQVESESESEDSSSFSGGVSNKNRIGLFQPGWVRAKILPLTEDNFDAWELSLRNVFYANDWNAIIEAVDDSDTARAKVIPEMRKIAWGCVTASLLYDLGSLTVHVSLGEVEKLIRTIFAFHFRNSASSRGSLKDKLHSLKLEDYKSFEIYVSSLKSLQIGRAHV